MKLLSRSLAVTLTLIFMGSLLFSSVTYGAADADFPLEITIGANTYRFATHGGSATEGNWIELSGGTDITIPPITLYYNGIDSADYTKDANVQVGTDASFIGDDVVYPFSTHPLYAPGAVNFAFKGKTSMATHPVECRIIKINDPLDYEDAFSDMFRGTPGTMETLLNTEYKASVDGVLDGSGDISGSFAGVAAGDYLIVVMSDIVNTWTIYSATFVEVLDGALAGTVPTEVREGDDLDIDLTLTGGNTGTMVYGVAIIKESAYNANLQLTSSGLTDNTELTFNGATVVDGGGGSFELFGGGLGNLDKSFLTDFMADAFSSDEYAVAFSSSTASLTQTVSVTTNDLSEDDYVVLMGVWDYSNDISTGNRLLGFTQDTVFVDYVAPSGGYVPPPSGGVVVVPPTADELDDLDPEDAADALESLGDDEAADLVEELSTEAGSEIVEKMTTTKASAIVLKVNTTKASAIIEKVSSTSAAGIVKEAVTTGKTSEMAAILVSSQKNAVGKILLEGDVSSGAKIVKEMATQDLNKAAERVEEMVKEQIKSLDPEQKNAYRKKMKDVIQSEDLSVDDLVNLFTEIANLPETPSTVAEIFEVIDLSKTLEVVEGMVVKEKYSEVATVFSFLSTEKLAEVYSGLLGASRVALYPYFDIATLGNLPQLGEFTATVELSDTMVEPGETVTVTATITNIGDVIDSTTVDYFVDGVEVDSEVISLGPGESTTITWTISEDVEDTYTVEVLGESESFTVQAPPAAAEFSLSSLQVSPSTIEPDVDVTVTFTVTNTGELTGDYEVEVMVDGAVVDTKTGSLDGGDSQMLTSTVTSDVEGVHSVAVDGLSAEFGVEVPAPEPGVSPIVYGIALVVIAAVAYFYMQSQKE